MTRPSLRWPAAPPNSSAYWTAWLEEARRRGLRITTAPNALVYTPWTSARPNQLTPPGDWIVWLILAGRGWGKTRTGAEDAKRYGVTHPGARIAIVAPTFGDARDVCIEGESGLLSILPKNSYKWNSSRGQLVLSNGTIYQCYSAEEPNRLRGKQHHRAWCDELAAWRYPDTWDQLMLGLRLGEHPQAVVTTTPKPIKLVRDLLARDDVHVTRGSTYENAANLPRSFVEQIVQKYEGTRLGRQELYAELLDDVPGALWTRAQLDDLRVKEAPELVRIVVALDPAVTSGEDSDETGIVVAGKGVDGHAYVLADLTCRMSPDGWARRAVNAYHDYAADRIVAEVNNGGDLVERVVRTVDRTVAYRAVHATKGKRVRAEPIAALYEQKRVHHVGAFAYLEDQMCNFLPDGVDYSPDRVDALVWALTDLMLGGVRLTPL